MKIGSLCTGYGGLDMAVEAYFGAKTIWVAEFDKYASQIIDLRWELPNYGDITKINWGELDPIDILTAGYPCQPFSHAGQRKGENDERHIWPDIKKAISELRPRIVILENVRGHLSLGFKEVLQELTEIGYDATWTIIRASDVGAPHQRARLFIIAYPTDNRCSQGNALGFKSPLSQPSHNGCFTDSNSCPCQESRRANLRVSRSTSKKFDRSDRKVDRFSREMDRQNVPDTLDQDGKLNANLSNI
jgi:DNA-cytosine methyltransferase